MSKKELGENNLVWDVFFGIKKMIRETDDPEERLKELENKKAFLKRNWDVIDQQEFAENFEMIDAEIERARTEIDLLDVGEKKVSQEKSKPETEQERYISPLEKVEMVEKVRRRPEINSYEEALDEIEREEGVRVFKDYASFNTQRYKLKS